MNIMMKNVNNKAHFEQATNCLDKFLNDGKYELKKIFKNKSVITYSNDNYGWAYDIYFDYCGGIIDVDIKSATLIVERQ